MLMDALFDKNLMWQDLIREDFALVHNLHHPHGFSDEALRRKLDEWLETGILREGREEYPDDSWVYHWYGLTEAGGKLWEEEREPWWERYCTSAFWSEEEEGEERGAQKSWLSIRSLSLETARAFLTQVCQGFFYAAETQKAQTILHQNDDELLPWKLFDRVYEILVPAVDVSQTNFDMDWQYYESCRTWWNRVEELNTLKN